MSAKVRTIWVLCWIGLIYLMLCWVAVVVLVVRGKPSPPGIFGAVLVTTLLVRYMRRRGWLGGA